MSEASPISATYLAKILGVSRRTLYKWRKETTPAPENQDLTAWLRWLKRSGRWQQHAALEKHLASSTPAVATVATVPSSPQKTGPNTPAAQGTPALGLISGMAPLPSNATDAQRRDRAKAISAEMAVEREQVKLEEVRGQLVPAAHLNRLGTAIGAIISEALTSGIWDEISPHLDAVSATDRKHLRAAHDDAMRELRSRLGQAIGDQLTSKVEP